MGHKFPMVPSRRLLNAGPLVVAGVFSNRGSQNGGNNDQNRENCGGHSLIRDGCAIFEHIC